MSVNSALPLSKILLVALGGILGAVISLIIATESYELMLVVGIILAIPLATYLFIAQYRYFVGFVVFLFPLSLPFEFSGNVVSMPSEILLTMLFLFFVMRTLFVRLPDRSFLANPISILLILDLLWTLVTALTGTMPEVSMKRFIMKFMFISVFYFSWTDFFKSPKNVLLFFVAYALGMIIPIFNTFKNHSVHDFLMRAAFFVTEPFYNDHTIYAACITFVLISLLVILTYNRKEMSGRMKTTLSFLVILLIVADFLAFSRAAWLSMAFGLILWFALHIKLKKIFLVPLIIMVGALVAFNFNMILDSFERNSAVSSSEDLEEHIKSFTSISSDVSNAERLNRWVSAWEMFREKPIMGFGPGTYQFQYGRYQHPEYMTRISTFQGDKGNAHSEYLNVLSESGIIGLLILLALLFAVFRIGIRNYLKSQDREHKIILMLCILALATYFVHGVVNAYIETDKASILVYSAIAVISLSYSHSEKDEELSGK